MKRIYLSGPMTGIPEFNFPAFNAEAARLRALGYDVVNPADINAADVPYNQCLRNDLKALMDCDTIAMLPGWMSSNGAHLEMHLAHRVGIEIVDSMDIVAPAARKPRTTIFVVDISRANPAELIEHLGYANGLGKKERETSDLAIVKQRLGS